jgi:hypothetical protein
MVVSSAFLNHICRPALFIEAQYGCCLLLYISIVNLLFHRKISEAKAIIESQKIQRLWQL